MSTKSKTLSYTFPTSKDKLIEQCINDLTNYGYMLVGREDTREGDTIIDFTLESEPLAEEK